MTHLLVQPRDRIFVKGYRFFLFAKNMVRKIGKIVSGYYSNKLLYHAKESSTYALKTASKMTIQNTEKSAADLIGNIIVG